MGYRTVGHERREFKTLCMGYEPITSHAAYFSILYFAVWWLIFYGRSSIVSGTMELNFIDLYR
jgi:hypothetical protein